MFYRLKYLDVSLNEGITLKGILKYVLCSSNSLVKVTLSANSSSEVHNQFAPKWKLIPNKEKICGENKGLAKELLDKWEIDLKAKMKAKKSALKNSNFYGCKTQEIPIEKPKPSQTWIFHIGKNEGEIRKPESKRRKITINDEENDSEILNLYI